MAEPAVMDLSVEEEDTAITLEKAMQAASFQSPVKRPPKDRMHSASSMASRLYSPTYHADFKQKMEQKKKEMLKEYTFSPKVSAKAKRQSIGAVGTSGASVFDRLYQKSKEPKIVATPPRKKKFAPDLSKSRKSFSASKQAAVVEPQSTPTRKTRPMTSTASPRVESLYQRGLRRALTKTDKDEALARKNRLESEELKKCTFQPELATKKKVTDNIIEEVIEFFKMDPMSASTTTTEDSTDGGAEGSQ